MSSIEYCDRVKPTKGNTIITLLKLFNFVLMDSKNYGVSGWYPSDVFGKGAPMYSSDYRDLVFFKSFVIAKDTCKKYINDSHLYTLVVRPLWWFLVCVWYKKVSNNLEHTYKL